MNHIFFTDSSRLTMEPADRSSAVLDRARFRGLGGQLGLGKASRASLRAALGDNNRRDAMTDIAPENLDAIHRRVRQCSLTREQVFRLWKCAIKDDDSLVDEMIQQMYEHIIAFDCERAECVIELVVRRNASAICAFRALLRDMRSVGAQVGLLDEPQAPQNA